MGVLLLAITVSAVATAAAPQVEIETLDGRTLIGSLAELDSQRAAVETAGGRVSVGTGELLQLSLKDPPVVPSQAPQVWVELVDGSSLIGVEFVASGSTARVKLLDGSAVEVPTAGLASVRLQEQSEQSAAEWSRIIEMRHTTDLLLVRSGDVVDYHKGVLRDVSPSTVQFELDGELLPVKRSKVYGLVYYHPPETSLPEPICQVSDAGGSRWAVQTLKWDTELTWTTPGGLKRTQPLSTVRQIDFSRGKIVFLSDLSPESVSFTPYFAAGKAQPLLAKFFALREDKNLESGPLRLDSKQYRKGLALHSRTKVVYRLPALPNGGRRAAEDGSSNPQSPIANPPRPIPHPLGGFRRFQATVGIDDAVRPRGNVRLVIYGDDRVLLECTVTGADPPRPVDLDLAGVRRLAILVDFGGEMDVADHLDLCDARILK
jgi:hypothetical protein